MFILNERMWFLFEHVFLRVSSRNVGHIKSVLGDWVEMGTIVKFPNLSLPKGSNEKVWIICPECGEIRERQFIKIIGCNHTFCNGCARLNTNKKKLLGEKFERLTVIGFSEKPYVTPSSGERTLVCICQCTCGNQVKVRADQLKNGNTSSCGCIHSEIMSSRVGPLHPNYNHDVTEEERRESRWQRNSPEYVMWRWGVYKRDNFTCQSCYRSGVPLVAHHMNGWAEATEQRFDVNNGKTLCECCHDELHAALGGEVKSCLEGDCDMVLAAMKNVREGNVPVFMQPEFLEDMKFLAALDRLFGD